MEIRRVADLKPHPDNARIYGDGADADLARSVRDKGILVPLLITWDNRVIAGHRRLDAAGQAGLADVPVTVFPSQDELDITEALIHANRQRVKTNEQIGREAALLLTIEKERAARRKKESTARAGKASGAARNGKANEVEPVPPRSGAAGKARDKVGEALGVSGKTAERAAAVVEKIDTLNHEGRDAEAEELRQTLNRNGVGAAHKEMKQRQPEADDEPNPDTDPTARKIMGKGVILAHEAINCLARIPKNDPLRKRGFQIVTDFIERNGGSDEPIPEADKPRRKRGEPEPPELRQYISDMTGRIEGEADNLETVSEEDWEYFDRRNPSAYARLVSACEAVLALRPEQAKSYNKLLAVQLEPLLQELEEWGRAHEAAMSPVAIRVIAFKLRKLFESSGIKPPKSKARKPKEHA